MNVKCDYCNKESELVDGSVIYPHRPDLFHKYFYRCVDCLAHVGCHPNTTKPLGRLANKELRQAKSEAHLSFDKLWKRYGMDRNEAYAYLADKMGIDKKDAHIGMFTVEQCKEVVKISKRYADKRKKSNKKKK